MITATATARNAATDRQLAFLFSLDTDFTEIQAQMYELIGEDARAAAIRGVDLAELRKGINKRQASDLIDRMKTQLAAAKRTLAAMKPAPAQVATTDERVELEDGIYLLDGVVVKLRHAVHGNGRQYARGLDLDDRTSGGKPRFSKYIAGAMPRLTPDHKMTMAQAREFGETYGMCVNCGATLTDETSIERAMGPICAGKFA